MRPETILTTLVISLTMVLGACSSPTSNPDSEVAKFFAGQNKTVVTFVGYSGAGYEDEASMLASAREVLSDHDPGATIVNIGATEDGIGAVYELAKSRGFETTGIVSTQAKEYGATISASVDHVFFVEDESWGGLIAGTDQLSPTSEAMVGFSDVVVAIGGGEVARDELLAAKARGKATRFFAADMNHAIAREKAHRKEQPEPTDFRGAAGAVFGGLEKPRG